MIARLHNSRIYKKRTPLCISKKYNTQRLTQDYINTVVALSYGIGVNECFDKTRKREICEIRQLMQYFGARLKHITLLTLAEIGEKTGGKDHATVLNSRRRIELLLLNIGEDVLRNKVVDIKKRLQI